MRGASVPIRLLVLVAFVPTLTGIACSKSTSNSQGGKPSASATSQTGDGTVRLEQGTGGELVFTPSILTVKQGQSIAVSNVGSAPHTFTVTGQGIDVVNEPGQSQNITLNLPRGSYPFICRFHVQLGMKGTLIVK